MKNPTYSTLKFSGSQGEIDQVGRCALALGEVYLRRGPFDEGITLLSRSLSELKTPMRRARIQHLIGRLMHLAGKPACAAEHQKEALTISSGWRCKSGDRCTEFARLAIP